MDIKTPATVVPKSNVDLLSDLDITINHAPLLPAVQMKEEKEEAKSDHKVLEEIQEKALVRKDSKLSLEDKNENLQIVWDTWYLDVQPKKDPLGEPTILQKFVIDIEKYEKFVDSLLVITLSGAKNIDIKWKEVKEFEVCSNKILFSKFGYFLLNKTLLLENFYLLNLNVNKINYSGLILLNFIFIKINFFIIFRIGKQRNKVLM